MSLRNKIEIVNTNTNLNVLTVNIKDMKQSKKENAISWIAKKHRTLDKRALELQSRKYLTADEEQELREIKVQKLQSKDLLASATQELC